MEVLSKDAILEYNENTMEEVRKLYNLDKPRDMRNVVDILENWVKLQPHFEHKDFERRYLETTIIVSKGSIEKSKSRLDRGCTLRTLMPHLFGMHDIRYLYKTDVNAVKHVILPKMSADNTRVCISQVVINDCLKDTAFLVYARCITVVSEYLRRNDYAKSYDMVVDITKAKLREVVKTIKSNTLHELLAYCFDCCGYRVGAIYIIMPSTSKLLEMAVIFLSQLVGPKIGSKIRVLKGRQSLSDIYNRDILPKDYGGHCKAMEELHEEWLNVLTSEQHIQYMKEINSARTDETRRQQSAKFNEEYLGMPGSFRKLNVD